MDQPDLNAATTPAGGGLESLTLDYYRLADLQSLVDRRPQLNLHPSVAAKIDAGAKFVLEKAA